MAARMDTEGTNKYAVFDKEGDAISGIDQITGNSVKDALRSAGEELGQQVRASPGYTRLEDRAGERPGAVRKRLRPNPYQTENALIEIGHPGLPSASIHSASAPTPSTARDEHRNWLAPGRNVQPDPFSRFF
jgi:hypothetical protein